jgi:lysozyme family protein
MCPLKAYLFESCSAKGKWTQLNMKNYKHIHQRECIYIEEEEKTFFSFFFVLLKCRMK